MHPAEGLMNRFRRLDGPNSYAEVLGDSIERLLPESGAWLDIGCGAGVAVRQMARRRPDVQIFAVDLLPGFENGRVPPGNLQFVQADACSLPFQGPQFDLVTAVHVLHFLADKQGALRQWWALLHPRGRLLANVDWGDVWIGQDWPTARPLGEGSGLLTAPPNWGIYSTCSFGEEVNGFGVRSVRSLYRTPREV